MAFYEHDPNGLRQDFAVNGYADHIYENDYEEEDYDLVDYRPSDESRPESPGPDELPRLPSPSETSSEEAEDHEDPGIASRSDLNDEDQGAQPDSTAIPNASPISRQALAQRLARIARQLATTTEDELPLDELVVMEHVNQIEMNLLGIPTSATHQAPKSAAPEPSSTSQTAVLPIRTRPLPKNRTSRASQEAVSESAMQLSQDLDTLHKNLRARHEEATHIQALLLNRLELAAQRILYLQRHADELEGQLQASDDELSHLRVLLKALEIQVPEHPDEDMRRCLVRVREEFWAVRKRREAIRRNDTEANPG